MSQSAISTRYVSDRALAIMLSDDVGTGELVQMLAPYFKMSPEQLFDLATLAIVAHDKRRRGGPFGTFLKIARDIPVGSFRAVLKLLEGIELEIKANEFGLTAREFAHLIWALRCVWPTIYPDLRASCPAGSEPTRVEGVNLAFAALFHECDATVKAIAKRVLDAVAPDDWYDTVEVLAAELDSSSGLTPTM